MSRMTPIGEPRTSTSDTAFFLPVATDATNAEMLWEAARIFAVENTGAGWEILKSQKRIFRIDYVHNGENLVAEVGQLDQYSNEKVQAILEAESCFCIITPKRGLLEGMPILSGRSTTSKVIYFK